MSEPNLVVLTPDCIAITRDILRTGLDAVGNNIAIVTRVPDERPASFIRLQATGGHMETPVSFGGQVTMETWAPTELVANASARYCLAILKAARGTTVLGSVIYAVRLVGGPVSFPDPVSGQDRCQTTVIVAARGSQFPI